MSITQNMIFFQARIIVVSFYFFGAMYYLPFLVEYLYRCSSQSLNKRNNVAICLLFFPTSSILHKNKWIHGTLDELHWFNQLLIALIYPVSISDVNGPKIGLKATESQK